MPLIFELPLGGVAIGHQGAEPVDRLAAALERGGIGGEFLAGVGELAAGVAQWRAAGLAGGGVRGRRARLSRAQRPPEWPGERRGRRRDGRLVSSYLADSPSRFRNLGINP